MLDDLVLSSCSGGAILRRVGVRQYACFALQHCAGLTLVAGLLRASADRGAAPAQLALLAAGFLAPCIIQYPACSELSWMSGTGLFLHSIFVSGMIICIIAYFMAALSVECDNK